MLTFRCQNQLLYSISMGLLTAHHGDTSHWLGWSWSSSGKQVDSSYLNPVSSEGIQPCQLCSPVKRCHHLLEKIIMRTPLYNMSVMSWEKTVCLYRRKSYHVNSHWTNSISHFIFKCWECYQLVHTIHGNVRSKPSEGYCGTGGIETLCYWLDIGIDGWEQTISLYKNIFTMALYILERILDH